MTRLVTWGPTTSCTPMIAVPLVRTLTIERYLGGLNFHRAATLWYRPPLKLGRPAILWWESMQRMRWSWRRWNRIRKLHSHEADYTVARVIFVSVLSTIMFCKPVYMLCYDKRWQKSLDLNKPEVGAYFLFFQLLLLFYYFTWIQTSWLFTQVTYFVL